MAQMYTMSNGAITGGPHPVPSGASQPPLVIPLYGPAGAYRMPQGPVPVGSLTSGPFPGGPMTGAAPMMPGAAPFGGPGIPPFGGGPMLGPQPIMPQPGIGPSPFGGPGIPPFGGGPMLGPQPIMPQPGIGPSPFGGPGNPTIGPAPMMPGPGFCGPMTTPGNGGIIPSGGPGIIMSPPGGPGIITSPPGMAIASPPIHQAAQSAPAQPAAAPGPHEGTDTIQSKGGHRLAWVEAGMQGHPIWRK